MTRILEELAFSGERMAMVGIEWRRYTAAALLVRVVHPIAIRFELPVRRPECALSRLPFCCWALTM
jgi:hypothetical protein